MDFKIKSKFKPAGSQPEAIKKLVKGLKDDKKPQTLIGVTGSGKTFTVANVIEKYNRPTLVLAHNKTLAKQLYHELSELFPENRVEYFVSFYDYYQPESYIPAKDQYIEKDSQINQEIERMRLLATSSLLSRDDVIVVASVSCIYGLGNPANYKGMSFELVEKSKVKREDILKSLINIQYTRNDMELQPGRFRVKGDIIDFIPGYASNVVRIEMFGDEIERIVEIDKVSGEVISRYEYYYVYPAKHFVVLEEEVKGAITSIKEELDISLGKLEMLEAHRLKQRTLYDIEMLEETGYCKGIENYSLHFDGRKKGDAPYTLLDYFPKDFLIVIDESHQSLPQVRGMYAGDRARKKNLIEYGFRLETAFDNRPLNFSEFEKFMKKNQTIFVSATPGDYEFEESSQVVEQIIRPTGLVDPKVIVRKSEGQIKDLIDEVKACIKSGNRALVTTITKKLAEELSEFLSEAGIKTRYLHSEIKTLERSEIIRELRLGEFDCLVGINLLREGIDIPEVGFVGILDADKEGFLRNKRSLIQIIGRAARNIGSRVVLYADTITDSIRGAIDETNRRRDIQVKFNLDNGIEPKKVVKPIREKLVEITDVAHIPKKEISKKIEELEMQMEKAAKDLEFEFAITLRNKLNKLKERL